MSSMVVRFPDGSKEFRYPEKTLAEGDVVWHDGERFRVISVSTDEKDRAVVIVEADSGIGDMLRSEEGAVRGGGRLSGVGRLGSRGCGVARSHPRGSPRLRNRRFLHRGGFRQRSKLAGRRSVRASRGRHHRRICARAASRQPKCRARLGVTGRRSSRHPPRRRCPHEGSSSSQPHPESSHAPGRSPSSTWRSSVFRRPSRGVSSVDAHGGPEATGRPRVPRRSASRQGREPDRCGASSAASATLRLGGGTRGERRRLGERNAPARGMLPGGTDRRRRGSSPHRGRARVGHVARPRRGLALLARLRAHARREPHGSCAISSGSSRPASTFGCSPGRERRFRSSGPRGWRSGGCEIACATAPASPARSTRRSARCTATTRRRSSSTTASRSSAGST